MTDAEPTMVVCRHCLRRKMARWRRGLCYQCSLDPALYGQYPTNSKYGRRGTGNGNTVGKLPEPTTASPGTPEKMAVLADRAAAGLQLWHPLDSTLDPEGPTHAES